jgi:outer membrane receptor protein involved in Fe transport
LTPRLEYLFEGHSFYNDTNDPLYSHGWINLLNAKLTFASLDRHWSASLYGENLGDKLYVPYSVAVLGSPIGSPNRPRTFGMDIRYDW